MSSEHRLAAITAAQQAAAKENGPVAGLFENAAAQMRIAHSMAAASEPGGAEATGESKQQLSERDLEEIFTTHTPRRPASGRPRERETP